MRKEGNSAEKSARVSNAANHGTSSVGRKAGKRAWIFVKAQV
ncbi:DUF7218 family protein [Mycobacterium sp. URHB0021]